MDRFRLPNVISQYFMPNIFNSVGIQTHIQVLYIFELSIRWASKS